MADREYKTTEARRAANRRWDNANMTNLGVKVRKSTAEEFRQMCKDAGTTPSTVLREAIIAFMAEHSQD